MSPIVRGIKQNAWALLLLFPAFVSGRDPLSLEQVDHPDALVLRLPERGLTELEISKDQPGFPK